MPRNIDISYARFALRSRTQLPQMICRRIAITCNTRIVMLRAGRGAAAL